MMYYRCETMHVHGAKVPLIVRMHLGSQPATRSKGFGEAGIFSLNALLDLRAVVRASPFSTTMKQAVRCRCRYSVVIP